MLLPANLSPSRPPSPPPHEDEQLRSVATRLNQLLRMGEKRLAGRVHELEVEGKIQNYLYVKGVGCRLSSLCCVVYGTTGAKTEHRNQDF